MTTTITLRTGKEVPETAMRTTTIALAALSPVALYELVEACRNPAHVPWGGAGREIISLGLADYASNDGTLRIHEIVRDVVLASVEGADADLRLVSPLAS